MTTSKNVRLKYLDWNINSCLRYFRQGVSSDLMEQETGNWNLYLFVLEKILQHNT